MGFYSSATLICDAQAHGIVMRPVSVLCSEWLCTIENDGAIRLGLSLVKGMDSAIGKRIVSARAERLFASLTDFQARVPADKKTLRTLAGIGALNGLVEHRRAGLWKIETTHHPEELAGLDGGPQIPAPLASMNAFERLDADFAGTGVTTGRHPMALIRKQLPEVIPDGDLPHCRNGQDVRIAGLVICRQRPGTAKGFVFVSLEDETGVANAIVDPKLFSSSGGLPLLRNLSFSSVEGPKYPRTSLWSRLRRIDPLPYPLPCASRFARFPLNLKSFPSHGRTGPVESGGNRPSAGNIRSGC
jgi:error-prone DNA polymerase